MQHNRLFNALAKVGATIEGNGYKYTATKPGGSTVTWYINGGGRDGSYVGYVTKRHPDTDAMYDNFMDSYFKTIKGAVEAICEQPYTSYKTNG